VESGVWRVVFNKDGNRKVGLFLNTVLVLSGCFSCFTGCFLKVINNVFFLNSKSISLRAIYPYWFQADKNYVKN
jgi:hypothetical protein